MAILIKNLINNFYQMVDSEIFALRSSLTYIFEPTLLLYSFLLLMLLHVCHFLFCYLVSFHLSCAIVIIGVSKCVQIGGSNHNVHPPNAWWFFMTKTKWNVNISSSVQERGWVFKKLYWLKTPVIHFWKKCN